MITPGDTAHQTDTEYATVITRTYLCAASLVNPGYERWKSSASCSLGDPDVTRTQISIAVLLPVGGHLVVVQSLSGSSLSEHRTAALLRLFPLRCS